MRVVISRTSLTADLLRAWERRYRAVQPQRTKGGQRLYSEADVHRLQLLKQLSDDGHAIGEIGRLDVGALEQLLRRTPSATETRADGAEPYVRAALDAAAQLNAAGIEDALRRAAMQRGTSALIDEIIPEFLRQIGKRWHAGAITTAHEHLASSVTRRVIAWTTDSFRTPPHAPRLVVATAAGDQHEFGAILASAVAAEEGWNVTALGAGLPARDAARAAEQLGARAVAVSAVYDTGKQGEHVRALAAALPRDTAVFAGGAALTKHRAALEKARIRVLADLGAFRQALRGLKLAKPVADE
jgi:methanogenic corrinoid protein MtbC1